jgi:hypothetical protein
MVGVVGKLNGIDDYGRKAQKLQREHSGGISDIAVGDMRLDG